MTITRVHTKLFEAAALDLDRRIRAQMDGGSQPEYLRDFEARVQAIIQFGHGGIPVGGRLVWLKRLIRRVNRPYWNQHVVIGQMMAERLMDLYYDLNKMAGAFEESRASMRAELDSFTDTLRAELAKAARRAGSEAEASERIPAGSRIVLGPLTVRRPGYVHIDSTGGRDADLHAPFDDLPVAPGTAAEILVANTLEAFPASEVRDRLLPYWASLLQPDGRLTIVADDLRAAADRFRDGQIELDELAEVFFGGDQARRSVYTPEGLLRLVAEAGLVDVSVIDRRQRPEAGAYAFELAARRPAA